MHGNTIFVGKIAGREKIHVRLSVGVDKKKSQRRWCLRGKIQSRLPRLTFECSEPLRDHDLDLLFFRENPDFVKFYIIYGSSMVLC